MFLKFQADKTKNYNLGRFQDNIDFYVLNIKENKYRGKSGECAICMLRKILNGLIQFEAMITE